MGLGKSHKPSVCRNIAENGENGEGMVQLFGFLRDIAKWTGMAIFLLEFEGETSRTTDERGSTFGSVKTRSLL